MSVNRLKSRTERNDLITALQKSFRKAFGTSVGKYILSTKMCAARRFLGEEGLSVKEVAARTGFATPNYFCQSYRAHFGHPPSIDRAFRPARVITQIRGNTL